MHETFQCTTDDLSTIQERKPKLNEIGSAFEDIGFAALKGHFK
jgi:hypothetical protein